MLPGASAASLADVSGGSHLFMQNRITSLFFQATDFARSASRNDAPGRVGYAIARVTIDGNKLAFSKRKSTLSLGTRA